MKISYNWIKQFITVPDDIEKHTALLTSLGLEVEGVTDYESIKGSLKGIIVGEVLICEKHGNADKLKVTTVNLGDKTVQIVCGALNVAAGQKVPVATIGTTLYHENGEPWKIKKGKIRGEESHGMICAEDELGLGKSHEGILVLDNTLQPGTPLSNIYSIETDKVIEIGLTPNRADAMSHMGVARDLRAGLAVNEDVIEFITPSNSNFHVESRSHKVDITVENSELAPRYCGVSITGITVKESPQWIKNRLKAIGITPKNAVVDITNYVMHELGQPLHAFDLEVIKNNKIVVKTATAGTKFKTLDGVEHELHQDDLMICDSEKPLCIAGVYGGEESGVTDRTRNIFLESAYFNPVSVRKTAKRHNLNTDASFRFERGIDPNITEYALKRAAILIKDICEGEIASDIIDVYPTKINDLQVFVPFDKINKLIGQEIPREEVKSILRSLDIEVNNITESGLGLTIPAYRNDVTRPADVIEEILRVYGYDRIESGTKLNATIAPSTRIDNYKLQNIAATLLTGIGFNEMMANSLTSANYSTLSTATQEKNEVKILNALSNDLSVMRQSMLYGMLEAVAFNINRKQDNLRLYEIGSTYHEYQDRSYTQSNHIGLITTGSIHTDYWNVTAQPSDFFYLKGVVTSLLYRLGITQLSEKETKADYLNEGISINSGAKLVDIGLVKRDVLKALDIDKPVYYANVYWDAVRECIKDSRKKVEEISKFPAVTRDLALLVDEHTTFTDLKEIALKTDKKLITDVNLFDVYTGSNLDAGKKSYGLSFTLLNKNKTLTEKQIEKAMSKIQQQLEKQAGAILR